MKLGEMLIQDGVVSQPQLDEALALQQEKGIFLGQCLVQLGHINQDTLVSYIVKQCKIPHLSLLDYDISQDILDLVPKELCLKHHMLPIDKLGRILTIAMVDPLDDDALEDVRQICPELRIKPILCTWEHFTTVSARLFAGETATGQAEYDATSLGLSPSKAKKKTPPAPEPEGDEAMLDAVNAVIEDAAEQAQQEVQAPSTPPAPSTAAGAPAQGGSVETADLVSEVREGVASALQDAMASLASQARAAGGPAGGSAEELGAVIRDSVASAMKDSLKTMAQYMRPAAAEGGGAEASVGELADVLRDAVKEALIDSEAAAVAQANLADLSAKRRPKRSSGGISRLGLEETEPSSLEAASVREQEDERVLAALNSDALLESLTFDSFKIGKTNEFTCRLCRAVAEKPGRDYNPFFLHGDVGLGKTHLINAIGNEVLGRTPEARIGYISASHFASRLKEAMRHEAVDEFRSHYCRWEVLILDDIQFLGGRVEAQEEFFHIFNVLQQENRQIIVASDKAPDRLGLLEQRLISRFAGGIVASLKPPEFETRMAILHSQMEQYKAEVNEEALTLLATRVPHDVRKMVGALRKIVAFAQLTGQPVSYEMADQVLEHLGIEEAA